MKSVWRVLFLVFTALFLVSAKSDDNLSKYLEVLEQSKGYRSFSFEDGVPKDGIFTQDKFGYIWAYSSGNKENLCRFNGHTWEPMLKYMSNADRSEIIDNKSDEKNNIYIVCKQAIYRWDGRGFTRFVLPKGSKTIQSTVTSGKLLVICDTGYCVLDDALWKCFYTRKPISKLSAWYSVITRTFPSKKIQTKDIVIRSYFYLDNLNTLYSIPISKEFYVDEALGHVRGLSPVENSSPSNIYIYSYTKDRTDSLLFIHAKEIQAVGGINNIHELVAQHQKGILFAIRDTNLLYYFDMNTKAIVKHAIKPEYHIVSMYPNFDGNAMNILCGKNNHLIVYSYGLSIGAEEKDLSVNYEATIPRSVNAYDNVLTYCNGRISSNDVYGNSSMYYSINPLVLKDTGDSLKYVNSNIIQGVQTESKSVFLVQLQKNSHSISTVINLFDVSNESNKTITIPGTIEGVRYIDGKSKYLICVSDDKVWISPFESSFSKLQEETTNYFKINTNKDSRYQYGFERFGYETNNNVTAPKVSLKEQGKNGKLKTINTFDDFRAIGTDAQNGLIYLVKIDSDSLLLVYHDYKKASTIEIGKISRKTNLSVGNSQLFCQSGTKYSIYEKTNLVKDGRFESFQIVMGKYLINAKMSIDDLIDELSINLVDSNLAYSKRQIIRFDTTSIHSLGIKETMQSEIRTGKEPDGFNYRGFEFIEIPPIVYHLGTKQKLGSKQEFWPNLIDIFTAGNDKFVACVDSTKHSRMIRISKMVDAAILHSDSDVFIPISTNKAPNIFLLKPKNILYVITDDAIYYHSSDSQHRIPIKKSNNMGNLRNVELIDGDLWMLYTNGLVKCSLISGISFTYGIKDGLPASSIDSIWNFNNTLYFISNGTLYKANNTRSNVKTSIPWIDVMGSRFSTKKAAHLKYNQTDVTIPIDILNVLYPEKCILEYHLKGYDDTWRRRPYISQLEYNKLKPGKYEFEVKAYTPDGYVSAMAIAGFQIHPPFWGTWWAYLIYIVVVVYIFRYLYMMRNKQLQLRNSALEQQIFDRTRELQDKQRKMTESIEYASLIQRSMLPPDEVMKHLFQNHFVIWKPRDIVGGDFYWLHHDEENNRILFALVDCTGHGVPGALLSMTVNSLLNKVVKDRGITDPALILQILHKEIGAVLYQDKTDNQQDGFEISLLNLDLNKQIIHFAGAGLGFLMYDAGKLQKIQGDRYSIGGLKRRQQLSFNLQSFKYHPYTVLYLYSDGILDQPDPTSSRKKRLGSAALIEFVEQVHNIDLDITKTAIDTKVKEMLQYGEQRDDITIIGIQPG